jgi:hypothetical protein
MESFDLKKYLVENKITSNSRILNENFYAPDYIKQKYGNKAKEIEQNIHDAEESENNPNLWDHFTSLETSKEVEDFIQGFINENVSVNEEMDFSIGNTILAVINHLIDNDRQDVLDVLQGIPQWNELVDQATDM